MDSSPFRPLRPALTKYFVGQALVVLGAAGSDAAGSMLPLALGASAALLLTVPIVRQLAARSRSRRR